MKSTVMNSHGYKRNPDQMEFPVFKMSEETEKVVLQAIEDDRDGKTKVMDDADDFIDNL